MLAGPRLSTTSALTWTSPRRAVRETLPLVPDDPRDLDGAREPGELRDHEYAGGARGDGDARAPSWLQQLWHDSFNPELLETALRTSGGVHPDDVITQLRYAPLALTHLCWRNTVVEDWHAGPNSSLHDGEMMAANVATTRIFHQALWAAFGDRVADATLVCRDDFAPQDLESLQYAFADAYEAGFDPDRRLPHGRTLADAGGDTVDDLAQHAELQLESLLDQAERHGVAVVILWLAARGHGACRNWWGSPRWPRIVDALLARLDDRSDEHWQRRGWVDPPAEVQNTARFRHLLLSAPDELETATLQFCIDRAGIGFIRLDD